MNSTHFLYICLLSCYLIWGTHGIIVDKSVKVKTFLREFERFGFEKGGTIQFNGETEPEQAASSTRILVCSNGDFTRIINDGEDGTGGVCQEDNSRICTLSANISDPILSDFTITKKDLYHLLIINCAGIEPTAHLKYTLLNLNGQQLSIGYEPLPTLYMVLTVLWTTLLVGWCFLWIYYRRNRVPLHTLLVVVAFLKLMVVVVALCYWRICEKTGICLDQLRYLQSFLFAVSETAFFCALLLIAKGWRITRTRLPSSEIRTISVALILLLSTLLFFSFYNDGYYFLSLMIMYFFMLPKIFTSITRNTRALETQLLVISQGNMDVETDGVHQKIKLFKTLRTSVVIYLGSILLVNSMRIIMIWYLDWFNYVMNEVVVLLMMSLISYILLPHNRALFSSLMLFDGNLFPLFNVDDVFLTDPEAFFSLHETSGPDIADVVVVQYPCEDTEDKNPDQPNTMPLALVILDKLPDSSVPKETKEKEK